MTEHDQKQLFAKLLLKLREPFKAALELFPDDTGTALQVAHDWPKDPVVIAIKNGVYDAVDEMDLLPTKAELARGIWDKMQGDLYPDDYVKLGRLYADVRGFIEKPGTNINVDNKIQNNVAAKVDTSELNSVEDAERVYKEMLDL